jgi:uncharacterized protein (TIGR03435 family)
MKSCAGSLNLRLTVIATAIAATASCLPIARAQTDSGGAASATSPAKTGDGRPLAFDVVSVRRNLSGGQGGPRTERFGPTPDGYRITNMPLMFAIIAAYVPQSGGGALFTNNILGMPEWARSENYDIDARVSEANLAEWQRPASQKMMLPAMLQALLADRFKLVAHREMKETPVFELVVGKGGPKFKESTPDEPHPNTMAIPGDGGYMSPGDGGGKVRFFDATMTTFASIMSNLAGRPVQDKTGLTGRYDLSFQKPTPMGSPSAGQQEASDPGPTIFSAMEELGLKLEPAKGSTETLVVDHVERPSEN